MALLINLAAQDFVKERNSQGNRCESNAARLTAAGFLCFAVLIDSCNESIQKRKGKGEKEGYLEKFC